MAELSDVNVLCKFDEGSAIQSSRGFTDDFVIFTSSQRISVYRVCVNGCVNLFSNLTFRFNRAKL